MNKARTLGWKKIRLEKIQEVRCMIPIIRVYGFQLLEIIIFNTIQLIYIYI